MHQMVTPDYHSHSTLIFIVYSYVYIHACTHTYSTSGHSFSSLSSTGPANSSFFQPRSLEPHPHQVSTAAMIISSLSEEDVSSQASPLDATNQSGESIGNSSFGEEPGTSAGGSGSGVAAPLAIRQQKATAILPEVHPVTGEW